MGAPHSVLPHADATPRLELRLDGRCYVVDEAGARHRVHDVAYGPPVCLPGKPRVVPHESPKAKYRWFVREDGEERCYLFRKGEDRRLTPEALARQLERAEYPARELFDPATRGPR